MKIINKSVRKKFHFFITILSYFSIPCLAQYESKYQLIHNSALINTHTFTLQNIPRLPTGLRASYHNNLNIGIKDNKQVYYNSYGIYDNNIQLLKNGFIDSLPYTIGGLYFHKSDAFVPVPGTVHKIFLISLRRVKFECDLLRECDNAYHRSNLNIISVSKSNNQFIVDSKSIIESNMVGEFAATYNKDYKSCWGVAAKQLKGIINVYKINSCGVQKHDSVQLPFVLPEDSISLERVYLSFSPNGSKLLVTRRLRKFQFSEQNYFRSYILNFDTQLGKLSFEKQLPVGILDSIPREYLQSQGVILAYIISEYKFSENNRYVYFTVGGVLVRLDLSTNQLKYYPLLKKGSIYSSLSLLPNQRLMFVNTKDYYNGQYEGTLSVGALDSTNIENNDSYFNDSIVSITVPNSVNKDQSGQWQNTPYVISNYISNYSLSNYKSPEPFPPLLPKINLTNRWCQFDSLPLQITVNPNADSVVWSMYNLNDSLVYWKKAFNPKIPPLKKGIYKVFATAYQQCLSEVAMDTITIEDNVIEKFRQDTTVFCPSGEARIEIPPSVITYTWENGFKGREQVVSKEGWQYAYFSSSCAVIKDSIYVKCANPFIANIITANGDGKNDIWHIQNTNQNLLRAEVYSRWGQKIFDGSPTHFVNANISPGVYFYLLYTENNCQFKGWLEVMKGE